MSFNCAIRQGDGSFDVQIYTKCPLDIWNLHGQAAINEVEAQMTDDDNVQIGNLLGGYAVRYGCWDEFTGVLFALWNAVKFIFGMSNHQQAARLLRGKLTEALEGESSLVGDAREIVRAHLDDIADIMLQLYLAQMNHDGSSSSSRTG